MGTTSEMSPTDRKDSGDEVSLMFPMMGTMSGKYPAVALESRDEFSLTSFSNASKFQSILAKYLASPGLRIRDVTWVVSDAMFVGEMKKKEDNLRA